MTKFPFQKTQFSLFLKEEIDFWSWKFRHAEPPLDEPNQRCIINLGLLQGANYLNDEISISKNTAICCPLFLKEEIDFLPIGKF